MNAAYITTTREIIDTLRSLAAANWHGKWSLPPDREWLCEVAEIDDSDCAEVVIGSDLSFQFDESGIVNRASFEGTELAKPETRYEALLLVWMLEHWMFTEKKQ